MSAGAYSCLVQLIRRNYSCQNTLVVPGVTLSAVPQRLQREREREREIHEGEEGKRRRRGRGEEREGGRWEGWMDGGREGDTGWSRMKSVKLTMKQFLDMEYRWVWHQCTAFICIFFANEKSKSALVALTLIFLVQHVVTWLLQKDTRRTSPDENFQRS